jgi:hypothetical protein
MQETMCFSFFLNKFQSFLENLGNISMDTKLELFRLLKRNEALSSVAQGNAQVFFTPDQCNLTIESGKKK